MNSTPRSHRLRIAGVAAAVSFGAWLGTVLGGSFAPYSPDPNELAALRQALVPLRSTHPGVPGDDIQHLIEMIGSARIVGLGEGTHGTHEYFELKHRIIQALVERSGFDLIALELGPAEAERINDFVHDRAPVALDTGRNRGSVDLAETGLWNTLETRRFFEWLRGYNRAHGGPVDVIGFDVGIDVNALTDVTAFLAVHDQDFSAAADSLLLELNALGTEADLSGNPGPESMKRWGQMLDRLDSRLIGKRADLERRSSREYHRALRSMRSLRQHHRFAALGSCTLAALQREIEMADALDAELSERPADRRRVIVSAHNLHLARVPLPVWGSMGRFLARRHGSDFVMIGTTTGAGRFVAFDSMAVPSVEAWRKPSDWSIEAVLGRARRNDLQRRDSAGTSIGAILDLRGARHSGNPLAWLDRTWLVRHASSRHVPWQQGAAPLVRACDILIYLDSTAPSEHLDLLNNEQLAKRESDTGRN